MRKLVIVTFLGFVCSGLAGCGSSDSDGGGDTTAIALCSDAVNILCTKLYACPGNLGTTNGYSDEKDCEKQLGTQDRCTAQNADCLPGQTYQQSKGPACVAAYKAMTCDTLTNSTLVDLYGSPSECAVVCGK